MDSDAGGVAAITRNSEDFVAGATTVRNGDWVSVGVVNVFGIEQLPAIAAAGRAIA
jgi:hypothetical protein